MNKEGQTLMESLKFHDKLLMIPGPTNIHPRVLKAMSTPIISMTDKQFFKVMGEIQEGVRYLMKTKNHWTMVLSGTGTSAMEASICNLLEPGRRLMSLVSGYWGERVANMAERMNIDTIRVRSRKMGMPFMLHEIEGKPDVLYVCHGESSTGLLQPLEGIGNLCRKYDCILLVDGVVSLGSAPLNMDQLNIDVLYSAGQKALSGPPGVAPISLNDRAVEKIRTRKTSVPSFYMDLTLVARSWGIVEHGKFPYHYTPAINTLFGLREAIAMVIEEGIDQLVRRHQKSQILFESMLQQMGLSFYINQANHRLSAIISVLVPNDIDAVRVMRYLDEEHKILIGGPLLVDSNVPKFWRIGFLGTNANPKSISRTCQALSKALSKQRALKSRL
ncbi:hypothetical protein BLOT_008355 [Blomia tropicalis]|nr:hypothetical protein BLOT_008355 [Blomia tropicalis]